MERKTGFLTDTELTKRINEVGVAELRGIILAQDTSYYQVDWPFTLAGGLPPANQQALPVQYDKTLWLDFLPAGAQFPIEVPALTNNHERNYGNSPWGARHHRVFGTPPVVEVLSPTASTGNYIMHFLPLVVPMQSPLTFTTAAGVDNINPTSRQWFFSGADFDPTYVGGFLNVVGATNSVNNGSFLISAVNSPTTVTTATTEGLMSETFSSSVVGNGQAFYTTNTLDFTLNKYASYVSVRVALGALAKGEREIQADLEKQLEMLIHRIKFECKRRQSGPSTAAPAPHRRRGSFRR